MKKIFPVLLIAFSSQTLAEITVEEYPAALQGSWQEKSETASTNLTFFKFPQAIQIKSGDCVATGKYELQIAVDIPEKSSCWKHECFQMDISITETKGGGECSA